ncbi:ATP-dependent DNA ligase [Sciscionella sediminilitoris]|uniref:ATP-dependent DNA ligase n=1 Tax=Sciscionella sediminilitoris TaxID=1445613 RepID=UPI0004DEF00F|nr:ATP-dependent DNA ligase [Sciscionella sp. SE31]
MLFIDVVTTSATIAATRSRRAKIAALAELLRAAAPEEVAVVTAVLAGTPVQGRIGIGWRTLADNRTAPVAEPGITVLEIDAGITELAGLSGAGSGTRRREVLGKLFGRCTEAEQELLFRLLTGELRHGALEGIMTEAIAAAAGLPAEDVRRAFMLCGRLAETARAALGGGAPALAAFGIELGRPVRPMLASPGTGIEEAIQELGAVSIEYKLDGARIQVHKDGSDVAVFTRTLREITGSVPELVALVRDLPGNRFILDGESLTLTEDGKPRPFQETMSRFGAESERDVLLRPYFFDVLHHDGTDLLDEPLRERQSVLRELAPGDVITGSTDPAAANQVFDDALAAGHEGIVLKSLDSVYAAGRRGASWRKIKPVHTLDLIVLAAEWGHGRRTGTLSNLHLGARDPDGGEPIMVGKTFKGLTDELLAWQTQALQEIQRSTDGWTVTVTPELVVEIALDGAQRSTRYPGGLALRFARVVRYRPDKTPGEADTIDAVRALR